MSGQRRWLKLWSRTVGMPVGITDDDKSMSFYHYTGRCTQSIMV